MTKVAEDTKPEVTEAQVKASNDAEKAKWEDDFPEEQLAVPYKAEEKKEDKPAKEEPKDTEEVVEDEDEIEEVEVYSDPAPVLTTEDPGEFKPGDYSFQVTLADGKVKTIRTPEDAEKIADDPENFDTPQQLYSFIRQSQKMENQLEKDLEKHEAQKARYEEQRQADQDRKNTVETLASEFDYLAGKGLLPKVDARYRDADWNDPEVAKQPGVKEQVDLLNYMVKENELRAKAGIKPLTSAVDAFNSYQLENRSTKKEEERKAAGEARKEAGAKVAGVSPSQQGTYVPKGIAVGNPNVLKRNQAVWDN